MKKKLNQIDILNETTNQFTKKDTSPIIPQRSKIKFDLHIIDRFKFTDKQKEFIELALDKKTKLVFVSGPAGTSKSWISIYCALKLLNERRVSDIIYVRSAVESTSAPIGFLPGLVSDKLLPFIRPCIDKLEELLPKNEIDALMKDDRIITIPVGHLRGLHWNAQAGLLDEAQNCTSKELLTFATRAGEYSKIIVLGDPEQSDLRNGNAGGFEKMINIFDDEESRQQGIYVFRFTEEDIVRSKLVQFIVKKLRKQN
jgi:phosphate starvation-inducible PhoH-like protein